MYKNGLSAEQIVSATDKTIEEIKRIIAAVVNEYREVALLREGSIGWQLVKFVIENE